MHRFWSADVPLLVLGALGIALLPACGGQAEPERGLAEARFLLNSEINNLDPADAHTLVGAIATHQIYETLLDYHYLKRPYEVVPGLAERWDVSKNGLEWQFTLTDSHFYDPFDPPLWEGRNRLVNARDVLFSWLRIADAHSPSSGWWLLDGRIVGLNEWRAETARTEKGSVEHAALYTRALAGELGGLQARGDRSLFVLLTMPWPQFLSVLTQEHLAVVPHEAVARSGEMFLNEPVGSGPFFVADWRPHDRLVYERNPVYRAVHYPSEGEPGDAERGLLEDAGKPVPFLDRVVLEVVAEPQPQVEQFRRGVYARLSPPGDLFHTVVGPEGHLVAEFADRGCRLERAVLADTTMLCFQMEDPVVGSIPGDPAGNERRRLLRRAIALAYPQERFQKVVRAGVWAEPARTLLPPALPEAALSPASLASRAQDLDGARDLLAKAGWPGGKGLPPLQFETGSNDPATLASASLFKNAMAEIGIEIEIVPNTLHRFWSKLDARTAQLFDFNWALDYFDSENLLQLWYGPNAEGGDNYTNFRNERFDALFEQFRVMLPSEERSALAVELLGILDAEMPAAPRDHRRIYSLTQPWLRNHKVHLLDLMQFRWYRVDTEAEAAFLGSH